MGYDYPELYYRIYPKVINAVNDCLSADTKIDDITEEMMDDMVDVVYEQIVRECPEINEDPSERRYRGRGMRTAQIPFYGRRRIVRDLITIFLISELLRRSQFGGFWNYSNPFSYPL